MGIRFGFGVGPVFDLGARGPSPYTADVASYASGTLPMSGGRGDYVADEAAEQPTFIPSGIGGAPAIRFDDTNDALRGNNFASLFQSHNVLLQFDFEPLSFTTDGTIFHLGPTSGSGYLWYQMLTNGRLRVSARNTSNATIASIDLAQITFAPGSKYVVSVSLHDGVLDYVVDGIPLLTDQAFDLSTQDTVYTTSNIGGRDINGNNTFSPAHMDLYGFEIQPL